jgi:hypothetical protein
MSFILGSCNNPPKTKEETQNYLIPNGRYSYWIHESSLGDHTLFFGVDGTFEKKTEGFNNILGGIWEVESPGKIIIQYEDGSTYHIDVLDELELSFQPSGPTYTPR